MDIPIKRILRHSSSTNFYDDEKENATQLHISQVISNSSSSSSSKPLTPMQNLVTSMRGRLEMQLGTAKLLKSSQLESNVSKSLKEDGWWPEYSSSPNVDVSPGLAKLRNTPAGEGLKAKQHILEQKHKSTKNKSNSLHIGGGVCLWPDMDNMRLSQTETVFLVISNVFLVPLIAWCFYVLHGDLVFRLLNFTEKLQSFHGNNPISTNMNKTFNEDVLRWHVNMESLMNDIHSNFDVSLVNTSLRYQCCVFLYISGILTLLYFLVDNVLIQSKLSPNRIKTWVTLLTIMGLWTMLAIKLFVLAQRLEKAIEDNVHILSKYLGTLVHTDLELSKYHNVLLYWRTCCLPPTSPGVLTVMGVLALQDVTYYLQYYSLPVITALLSPIVKLIISLRDIYKAPKAIDIDS